MPGMVPAIKRIAVGDIHKGGIPVYQTNPMVSPLQPTSLMQLQQQPSYIPMSYPASYLYPSASSNLGQQPFTAQLNPQLAALSPTLLTPLSTTAPDSTTVTAAATSTSTTAGGDESNYFFSTPAAAYLNPTPTSGASASTKGVATTPATSSSSFNNSYYHLLHQQQQQQQQHQQSRLSATAAAVMGLGVYATPTPVSIPAASAAASPALPNNACYVEYFGNNKQLRDTIPVCQDFSAGLCNSPYCKKVHLSEDYVEVSNGSVTVCRDFATRQTCKRSRCKFYHIPVNLPPS
ncbi:muscleblind-like protein 2 [Plakobranchus ocellatus]|uniref:Muscleblind-like protein 2 n=1 Tax=Plakobranchus ocellatus TaxID=259542 RepID=A0AAV4DXR1_9GAST|nr:muscleblind-like protein 2 [Plakobranchus ocellatus]